MIITLIRRIIMNRASTLGKATLAGLLVYGSSAVADGHPKFPNSVHGTVHMVSAANPLASQAGLDILEAGGTAMDAAVAVQLVLNLVEPESSGIGGGAFLLYWDASEKTLVTYDGREKAPMSATPDYFTKEDGTRLKWREAVTGGLSVGVPGTLKLLETAYKDHGIHPWQELIQPAIDLAENGFPITEKLSESIEAAAERGLKTFPEARNYFYNEDGSAVAAGSTLKNQPFADALKMIAEEGSAPFYTGVIAESIVEAVKTETNTGQMTLEDLASYEVIKREPVCFPYRAYEVCGMGPPTSGGLTMGQILGILSEFDLPAMGPSAEAWHLYIEAAKLAYADRGMYMADADFVDMPAGLLNKDYLASRAALIDPAKTMGKATAGTPPWDEAKLYAPDTQLERPGTSHFSIIDRYGNMVSITTTIETGFGSRVMTHGFLLNNELTDFSFAAEKDGKPVANRVEGGKRPRSSMSPTIVFQDGRPVLLTGSPGGSRIINYVTQSVIGILDWGMDPQDAVDMPHVVNRNGKTDLEQGTDAVNYQADLESLGHEVNIRDLKSGLHTILIDRLGYYGAADPRREGVALGR
jgi:gamma-glutamyltranspeptidase/glutathione hydrolase